MAEKQKPRTIDMDSMRWAREFMEELETTGDGDENFISRWFAEAIQCGWDNAQWANRKTIEALRDEIQELKERVE